MRFPGMKATIGLPVLLALGITLIVYGFLRSDSSGIIFGIVDIVLSVVFYISTNVYKREDAKDDPL